MKKYRLVIFDMDGTLVDTSKGIYNCHKYVNKTYADRELTDAELDGVIGGPLLDTYRVKWGYPDTEARRLVEKYRDYYKKIGLNDICLYVGIIEFLEYLKKKNFLVGVSTLKSEVFAKQIIHNLGIGEYFDIICGMDENDTRTKNGLIDMCMDKMKVSKDDTILIGDSIHDAKGAKESGVDFIAVTYGFGYKNRDDVEVGSAILVVDNLRDLILED